MNGNLANDGSKTYEYNPENSFKQIQLGLVSPEIPPPILNSRSRNACMTQWATISNKKWDDYGKINGLNNEIHCFYFICVLKFDGWFYWSKLLFGVLFVLSFIHLYRFWKVWQSFILFYLFFNNHCNFVTRWFRLYIKR